MQSETDRPQLGGYELSATEVADILWLAAFMDAPPATAATAVSDQADQPESAAVRRGREMETPPSQPETEGDPTVPETAPTPANYDAPKPTAALYTSDLALAEDGEDSWGGFGFKAPHAPAILEKAALMRSLRPLQRPVPSSRRFALDEAQTAERIAAAVASRGGWLPVQHPQRERWLDLVVLVDGSPSMGVN